MTSAPVPVEDDRRRRRMVAWLLLALGLLLLGFGGWQVLDGDGARTPQARAQVHSLPTPVVVKPRSVSGTTTGSSTGTHTGTAITGSGGGLRLDSVVLGKVAPGVPAALEVTVTNTTSHPVVVTDVSGAVTEVTSGASSPACRVGWYHIEAFAGQRVLGAGGTTTVSLPLTFRDLADVNQDDCRGARYTYTVRAQGSSR